MRKILLYHMKLQNWIKHSCGVINIKIKKAVVVFKAGGGGGDRDTKKSSSYLHSHYWIEQNQPEDVSSNPLGKGMHLPYKYLFRNTTFQYYYFFFLNLIDLFLQCTFLNPPICCLNSCLWPWNSKFMMSSSAFFSKGIVLENENSMKILPCPFTPSPFLLLTSIALTSI